MPLDSRTKFLFARKLREMLKEMSFSRVTVSELCRRARVSNQAFYYHFRDKYELVAWMFIYEFTPTLYMPGGYSAEICAQQYELYYKDRDFWANLFLEASSANISNYLRDFTISHLSNSMKYYLGTDTLPAETKLWVRYQVYGIVGLLVDWITGVVQLTPQELGEFQYRYMRQDFRDALSAYGEFLAQKDTKEI